MRQGSLSLTGTSGWGTHWGSPTRCWAGKFPWPLFGASRFKSPAHSRASSGWRRGRALSCGRGICVLADHLGHIGRLRWDWSLCPVEVESHGSVSGLCATTPGPGLSPTRTVQQGLPPELRLSTGKHLVCVPPAETPPAPGVRGAGDGAGHRPPQTRGWKLV